MRTMWAMLLGLVLAVTVTAWAAPVQKVKVTMRDFGYTPAKITLVNGGKLTHEFMLYGMPKDMASMMGGDMGHEWVEKTNYFKGVQVAADGGKVKQKAGAFFELRIQPGRSATVRFTPVKKGTFEFSCMIADHYEAGQRGVLVVK